MAFKKSERRQNIRYRIRKVVDGTAERPRLSVFRSSKEIYAQIIDDVNGETLSAASSRDKEVNAEGTIIDIAVAVGKVISEKALKEGIEKVFIDQGGYLYHGSVKSLTDGEREANLQF